MRLAARGAREAETGGSTAIPAAEDRDRLRRQASGVWIRSITLATALTTLAMGLLLLR